MSKRKRYVITSFLLTSGFAVVQFLEQRYKFVGIGSLSILTILLFYWSLHEGLGLNFSLVSLILPFLFTIGVGFFGFCCLLTFLLKFPFFYFMVLLFIFFARLKTSLLWLQLERLLFCGRQEGQVLF